VTGESHLPVDLFNPGQVFACLGLMELSELLAGPCEGEFVADADAQRTAFCFRAGDAADPLALCLEFLREADVRALAPIGSDLAAKESGVLTEGQISAVFPCECPSSPSALPIRLRRGDKTFVVDHWADGSTRDNVKFWAGAGGYSGAALWRDALNLIRALDATQWSAAHLNPFDVGAPMSSSFRFDWRRDYVPLDLGFSLNDHSAILSVGFPFVELLAAVGIQNARPARMTARDKLNYRYGAWLARLPTVFARAIVGGQSLGFSVRRFHMRLDWPGQENQARCIVDVQEE
jgi:CRISPR-associated protein Csx14